MVLDNKFCGACHCRGKGSGKYGAYLSCPACGHIYIWKLDEPINSIYIENFPREILKRRKIVQKNNKQAKTLEQQFAAIVVRT